MGEEERKCAAVEEWVKVARGDEGGKCARPVEHLCGRHAKTGQTAKPWDMCRIFVPSTNTICTTAIV